MSITKHYQTVSSAKESFDTYYARCLGRGSSGSVFVFSEEHVIKIFSDDKESQEDLDRERQIFEALPPSQYIVNYIEAWEDGLILERLCSTVRSKLRDRPQSIDNGTRQRWIIEACRGLAFLHEKGIMHGDVGCHNYLVDHNDHIKLCDFAGSMRESIEGETARICYEIRGQHPEYRTGKATPNTEIFALGSTIFEIYTSKAPYSAETNAAVIAKYKAGKFPSGDLKSSAVRLLVDNCWKSKYAKISAMILDLEAIQEGDAGGVFSLMSIC